MAGNTPLIEALLSHFDLFEGATATIPLGGEEVTAPFNVQPLEWQEERMYAAVERWFVLYDLMQGIRKDEELKQFRTLINHTCHEGSGLSRRLKKNLGYGKVMESFTIMFDLVVCIQTLQLLLLYRETL